MVRANSGSSILYDTVKLNQRVAASMHGGRLMERNYSSHSGVERVAVAFGRRDRSVSDIQTDDASANDKKKKLTTPPGSSVWNTRGGYDMI